MTWNEGQIWAGVGDDIHSFPTKAKICIEWKMLEFYLCSEIKYNSAVRDRRPGNFALFYVL